MEIEIRSIKVKAFLSLIGMVLSLTAYCQNDGFQPSQYQHQGTPQTPINQNQEKIPVTISSETPLQDSAKKDTVKMESPQHIRGVLKSNPFPLLWGPVPFTSEFRLVQEITTHPYQSFQFGFSLLRKSPILTLFEDTLTRSNDRYTVKGWRFQIAKRYYLPSSGYAPSGLYVSPSFSYSTANLSTKIAQRAGYRISKTHYNASLLFGAQVILMESIAVDFFTGLGYQAKIYKEVFDHTGKYRMIDIERELRMKNWPVKFTLGFNLGICN